MRIVDVCAFYTPRGGGVRTYIDRKLQAAGRMGQELIALVPGESDSMVQVAPNAWIRSLATPTFPLDPRYRYFHSETQLHAALDELRPDFVECGTPWSSADMVANWRGDAPRAVIMHLDVFATYPYRWLGKMMDQKSIDRGFDWFWRRLRRLGREYDFVVCANNELGTRTANGGVPNVVIEPMGVEPGVFGPDRRDMPFRAQVLASCGLPDTATLLVGVGRHSPEKRWPMIVDAVTAVGYDHDVGMVIIGEGRDTPRIRKSIAGNPHIRLLEPTRDRAAMARLLASADCMVHGSESESFGMVGAEARASGLPLIVPDRGGMTDQAAGGMGWSYKSGNGPALTSRLRKVLGRGLIAPTRARSELAAADVRTMDRHFEELFTRYESCFARRRAA